MITFKTLDCSIISLLILVIILVHSYNQLVRVFIQYKLFVTLVILNMSLIVIDILSWVFNGLPGSLNYLCNIIFNLILYIATPMVPSVWVLYTYCLVYNDENKLKNIRTAIIIMLMINACIAFVSLFTSWYFYVDEANIYHRGLWFPIHAVYCEFLLFYSFIFIISKRKHFQKNQLYSIMVFFIAPLAGTIIQTLNYGVSYNWTGITISLLIVYFNMQSKNLNTDYLTGINNRLHLQNYIKEKIRSSSEKRTFGAIMIDIDNFKEINDKFGHVIGDEALKDAVQILRSCLRRDDFIARFGGDEFLVVIDVQTLETLVDTIKRIRNKTDMFNVLSGKPYNLSFSLGYDIYNVHAKMNSDVFINHLDQLMYDDKNKMLSISGDCQ